MSTVFPHTARMWNTMPIEYLPLSYDLNGSKSRINRYLLNRFSLTRFHVCFNLFVFFLVSPCIIVAVQLCMA